MAVKLIDKTKLDAKTQRMLVREIKIMDKLAHPSLIRCVYTVWSPDASSLMRNVV